MSFTCPRCGATSHNPNDKRQRYCGRCHVFIDDWPPATDCAIEVSQPQPVGADLMATQPHPQPPPKPNPPPSPKPPDPKPEAAKAEPPLPIGAKPTDPKDPQAVKFDPPHPAPPRWEDEKKPKPAETWTPKPALDPHAEKPPADAYPDGMPIAVEQRARSAWMESHGMEAYDEATDQRPADEKPKFDPHALAGGGAFVTAGAQKQVPGVTPPTKRE